MKTRYDLLSELRRTMDDFVGQIFTQDMRQRIRIDATELMHTAFDEGQSVMAPHVCVNAGTEKCRQNEPGATIFEYESDVCRECNKEGGFEI